MDDAYSGGERAGKRGRGSENKHPFIVAVETTQDGRPMKVHLRRVRAFRRTGIAGYAQASLLPGSEFLYDGLYCFAGVAAANCRYVPLITGSGRQAARHPAFKWATTMLSNVKNALPGTCHAIREKHVPRYLDEFEYRFNRRFDLPTMIKRLTYIALRTPPMPYHLLKMAEVYG